MMPVMLTETNSRDTGDVSPFAPQSGLFQNRSQLQIPFANLVLAYFAQSLMFVPVLVRERGHLSTLNVHLQWSPAYESVSLN